MLGTRQQTTRIMNPDGGGLRPEHEPVVCHMIASQQFALAQPGKHGAGFKPARVPLPDLDWNVRNLGPTARIYPQLWKCLWKSLYSAWDRERGGNHMTQPDPIARDNELLAGLRSNVSAARWSTWFSGVRMEFTEQTVRVVAPSDFHSRWLQDHYGDLIETLARDLLSDEIVVRYLTESGPLQVSNAPSRSTPAFQPTEPTTESPARRGLPEHTSRYREKYVFDNFVVGQSNRLALAASMAVAEKPAHHYNPLFLYGGAGLGKTHLLHAIGHRAQALRPDTTVECITSEHFFNDFVDGIRRKRMNEFKHRYRNIDLLLLDDVQFFQGKEQILEELFHTFNTLHQYDKQMVLTCDRPPKDLGIEERLRSRFQWGLLADIGPPDVETRLAILRRNAEYAPAAVPNEVLDFIARHITDNIRQLESALTRVTTFAGLVQERITIDLARRQLADLIPTPSDQAPTPPAIIAVVAASYGVSVKDMGGPSRREPLVTARQIAMYLCRTLTELSLPKIGKQLGGRDHSTILHGVNKISRLVQSDPQFARRVTDLGKELCSR